jgi:hypothetical protein
MKKDKICAISQPTFLPWIGWFDLADQSNVMVILDDVSFSKQSWQQRNRIRTRNGLEFLTIPIKTSGRLGQSIAECEIADQNCIRKVLSSLQTNYSKAPYFKDCIEELGSIMVAAATKNLLLELNCALISWMAARLKVATPMIRASSLNLGGRRGEHVAAICQSVEAGHYLSPKGAEEYLLEDKSAFDQRGITIGIQNYEHPHYLQLFSPFIPYASGLDLIFNMGPLAPEIMRSGRRRAYEIGNLEIIRSLES